MRKRKQKEEKDFKRHPMFHPVTGERFMANSLQEHLDMKKMKYTHDKPKAGSKTMKKGKGSYPNKKSMADRVASRKGGY